MVGCADGNLHLRFPSGRVEKSVPAHTGDVTCVSVNPDGLLIASGGEDGVVKIRSRNSILRTNLARVGGAVTSCNWDNTGKYLMFAYGWRVTVRSESFKQDQTRFRAHRHLVTSRS
jgi:WD40 repeat protein